MEQYHRLYRCVDLAHAMVHKPQSYFKHFSFVMKGTKIISIGWNNTYKCTKINNKIIQYPFWGTHSECEAVSKLSDLNICRKATMVNVRINNQGQIRMSMPCKTCMHLLKNVGFSRVYYTTNDGFEQLYL